MKKFALMLKWLLLEILVLPIRVLNIILLFIIKGLRKAAEAAEKFEKGEL